jgi:subtilisin family serine protease
MKWLVLPDAQDFRKHKHRLAPNHAWTPKEVAMPASQQTRLETVQLQQAIARQILHRTRGRIHRLEVEVIGERVIVRGCSSSYYVKQLALEGVLDLVGSDGNTPIELDIHVAASPARSMMIGCAQLLLFAILLRFGAVSADEPTDVTTKFRFASQQRALFDRLKIEEAWAVTKGDPKVLVGVVDNGFDFFHPDLKGQLIPGFYYPGGYHTEFYEGIAHGTLVSSLIVAKGDGAGGMVGLAPHCRVLTASQGMIEHTLLKIQQKFFQEHPDATYADFQKEFMANVAEISKFGQQWVHYQVSNAADAIHYLVDHGVRVINFSGGLTPGKSSRRPLCTPPPRE